ncbi:hypothetical protein PR048_016535 [Dryococelus australis]|uniref:Uncharacterized protein n=1 Tax=Dryococelus australis TaxID=614101 RepID=A0ABQ9HK92_9NEOP|nr:hypothetical protein PR048_016535 [Dryococelus australis]
MRAGVSCRACNRQLKILLINQQLGREYPKQMIMRHGNPRSYSLISSNEDEEYGTCNGMLLEMQKNDFRAWLRPDLYSDSLLAAGVGCGGGVMSCGPGWRENPLVSDSGFMPRRLCSALPEVWAARGPPELKGGGNRRSWKTRRPVILFSTIPTYENQGVTEPGIESGSPWCRFLLPCGTTSAKSILTVPLTGIKLSSACNLPAPTQNCTRFGRVVQIPKRILDTVIGGGLCGSTRAKSISTSSVKNHSQILRLVVVLEKLTIKVHFQFGIGHSVVQMKACNFGFCDARFQSPVFAKFNKHLHVVGQGTVKLFEAAHLDVSFGFAGVAAPNLHSKLQAFLDEWEKVLYVQCPMTSTVLLLSEGRGHLSCKAGEKYPDQAKQTKFDTKNLPYHDFRRSPAERPTPYLFSSTSFQQQLYAWRREAQDNVAKSVSCRHFARCHIAPCPLSQELLISLDTYGQIRQDPKVIVSRLSVETRLRMACEIKSTDGMESSGQHKGGPEVGDFQCKAHYSPRRGTTLCEGHITHSLQHVRRLQNMVIEAKPCIHSTQHIAGAAGPRTDTQALHTTSPPHAQPDTIAPPSPRHNLHRGVAISSQLTPHKQEACCAAHFKSRLDGILPTPQPGVLTARWSQHVCDTGGPCSVMCLSSVLPGMSRQHRPGGGD